MKNIILLILFLIIIFILNIIFYYNSSDYRMFLKWLKNEQTVINTNSWKLDDLSNIKEKLEKWRNEEKPKNDEKENINIKEEKLENLDLEEKNKEKKVEIKLWKNYTDIIDLFPKYKLELLEFNTNLFDITNEYPDKYFEYYSRDLTLYLFPTKKYSEIVDIFKILELELPFSINQTNNFWEESFYINLNSDIDDSIVRIVVKNKWVVFWLKIKKNEYNNVKKILNNMK